MKRYIVVKTNLLRNQSFYATDRKGEHWSLWKEYAHEFFTRRGAQKIATKKTESITDAWQGIIEYGVEEVKI